MTNEFPRPSRSANAADWDAIARCLAGESIPDEEAIVRRWLDEHRADREFTLRVGDASNFQPVDIDVESALRRVHARIASGTDRPSSTLDAGNPRGRNRRTRATLTLVALAAGIIAIVTVRRAPPRGAVAASGPRTYHTAVGQRDSITLSDGSRVILGPDSRLTVPGDYKVSRRAVQLRGDGYFDIRHIATAPFEVRVAGAVVEDLGTTFTVESDATDATTVSVLAGSVRLRPSDSPAAEGAVLAAGDRGTVDTNGHVRAFPHTAGADDAAWTSGRLVFRDASLLRVASEVRRWYGVNIRATDSSLLHRHVTTSFNGESIDQVLKIIGLTLDAHVTRQGDTATMQANGRPATVR